MFMIHMPASFQIGDTADVRINQEPKRLTWRSADTLVIEPGDERKIHQSFEAGDLLCFVCGDADGGDDSPIVFGVPGPGAGTRQ